MNYMGWGRYVSIVFALFVVLGFSVNGLAAVEEASSGQVTGSIDLRPAWTPSSESWITDNTAEFGYKFNPTFSLSYLQWFQTGLSERVTDEGLDLKIKDGFIRARASKLWTSEDTTWSLSLQERFYIPIEAASREHGNITTVRNYIIFTKTLSPTVSLSLMGLPIFHVYTKAGYVSSSGEATANPAFENRFYFIADFSLTDKLSLSFPLMFHQTRYRDYSADAKHNNGWGFIVWTYPEFSYALTNKTTLGLAYYSDNLIESDFSGLALGSGLENGVIEFSFAYSI